MSPEDNAVLLEEQIDRWRSYLHRRQTNHSVDVVVLEAQLREQVSALVNAGLATEEAFLVAVKRISGLDASSREFAREHSDRLWKQLLVAATALDVHRAPARTDAIVAFCLAVAAALAIKAPTLFGLQLDQDASFYARNLSFFVLPFLTGYFVWKRRLPTGASRWMALAFVAAAVLGNVFPFTPGGSTETLTALHLPIALWLVVGVGYAGGSWSQVGRRMDFIRFSGELFIYYALIALGGGVFMAFTFRIFDAIGITVEPFFESWLLPCGAAGAVLVASWLAEAKQGVIENMAPVLTRLFTPLFAGLLVTFLVTLLLTGRGVDIERNVLIAFDLLLVVVLGLLLYSISARDAWSPPSAFDLLQIVLVISAILADAVALWAMAARVTEFGFTPNRTVALGMNVILLVNLAWSAVLYILFLRGRGSFTALEQWQTGYLPVYSAWAAIVVTVSPLVFGYR